LYVLISLEGNGNQETDDSKLREYFGDWLLTLFVRWKGFQAAEPITHTATAQ